MMVNRTVVVAVGNGHSSSSSDRLTGYRETLKGDLRWDQDREMSLRYDN